MKETLYNFCMQNTDKQYLLEEWDFEKNDRLNLNIKKITIGSGRRVWWKCDKGHSYKSIVSLRTMNNTGCPYCARTKVLKGFNDLCTTHSYLVEEWDFEKNDELGIKPDEIMSGSEKKYGGSVIKGILMI